MREIYFDNGATTRVDADVAELCLKVMREDYGNPSSLHKKGIDADMRLTEAREQLAAALGCSREEIFFTSGGTESDNLAIFGAAAANRRHCGTIVTAEWEHPAVLEPFKELNKRGLTLKTLNPEKDGGIDVEKLAEMVDEDTALVSCMAINSETGGIADLEKLVRLIKSKNKKTLVHTDAVQAFGKLKLSAKKLGVDLLSVSGHKIHAPKGVGALYVSKQVKIPPLLFGGGQEKGIRPGTEALPLIAAFGLAAENAAQNLEQNYRHVSALSEHFVKNAASIDNLCINSPPDSTPYICGISLLGYKGETLLHYLAARGIYVSSGTACGRGKPSHALKSMRLSRERIEGALRISFSKHNTIEEIDIFFDVLAKALKEIKR